MYCDCHHPGDLPLPLRKHTHLVWPSTVLADHVYATVLDTSLRRTSPAAYRFSAPSKRSSSMRFSSSVVLRPHAATGYWCLELRVANMRKHIMIKPDVSKCSLGGQHDVTRYRTAYLSYLAIAVCKQSGQLMTVLTGCCPRQAPVRGVGPFGSTACAQIAFCQ